MVHKHHIIPRHSGGTNDPSNIVELTVEEHAEAHRLLFEEFGMWQDKLAWQGLAGIIGKEALILEVIKNVNKGNAYRLGQSPSEYTRKKLSDCKKGQIPWNKGKVTGPLSEEHKKNLSKSKIGIPKTEEHKRKIGLSNKGKTISEEQRLQQSQKMKNRVPWNKGRKLK